MRFKMGIKNYKSFKNKQNINFAPITIFVGPNSGGKSSILKLLGFLNENYVQKSDRLTFKGPIADLQSFKSITNNFNQKTVFVDFLSYQCIPRHDDFELGCYFINTIDKINLQINENQVNVNYKTVKSNEFEIRNYLKNNEYIFSKREIKNIRNRIYKNNNKYIDILKILMKVNTQQAKDKLESFVDISLKSMGLFCMGLNMKLNLTTGSGETYEIDDYKINNLVPYNNLHEFLYKWDHFDDILDSSSNIQKYLFNNLSYHNHYTRSEIENMFKTTETILKVDNRQRFEVELDFDENKDIFENLIHNEDTIYNELLINILWHKYHEEIFESFMKEVKIIEQNFSSKFRSTLVNILAGNTFIPPLRDKPRRFYSSNELIDNLFGKSVNNFRADTYDLRFTYLMNMVEKVNKDFELLGINNQLIIRPINDQNISDLYIVEINNPITKTNSDLQDVGYGFSQILPILFSINDTCQGEFGKLIIEQPELHLHPKIQTGLAKIICDKVGHKKGYHPSNNMIIMETHSEHIIRGLQVQIAQGKLSPNEVAVNYIGKYKNGNSFVKRMELTKKGLFKDDWPGELFEDSYNQSMELLKHQ